MIRFTSNDLDHHKFTYFNYRLRIFYNVDRKADRLVWNDFTLYRKELPYDNRVVTELDYHVYEDGWTYYRGLTIDFTQGIVRDNAITQLYKMEEKYKGIKETHHCVERAFINCSYNERQTYIDKMKAWLANHAECSMQAMENFNPYLYRTGISMVRSNELNRMCNNYICLPVRLIDKKRQLMFKLSWQTKLGISDLEVNDVVA